MAPKHLLKKRPASAQRSGIRKKAKANADVPSCTLTNMVNVPMVGFGTAFFVDGLRRPEIAYRTVFQALELGYRHIDSASMYGNERQVGNVIGQFLMDGTVTRENLFVTGKVGHPPTEDYPDAQTHYLYDTKQSAYDGALREFNSCFSNLGLGYVDLLLIHWPGMFDSPDRFPKGWQVSLPSKDIARQKRREMWAALEHLYERRLVRAIGVSNFTKEHLDDLMSVCKVKPMMNQFEVHPFLQQTELVDFCHYHDIRITAYSPLAAGKVKLLENEEIVHLARSKKVTPSQLVLSWMVQRGIIVIPKSSNASRMAENLNVSRSLLSDREMKVIADLDRGLRTCPDPGLIN